MHTLTDTDAEMTETPQNSDGHALHLMCHWTTIIRGKDIKKWKKVGERQTDKLIFGVRASAPMRSTFDLVCLTHVKSTHAYVHFALSVCVHSFKTADNNQAVSLQLNKQYAFNSNSLTAN